MHYCKKWLSRLVHIRQSLWITIVFSLALVTGSNAWANDSDLQIKHATVVVREDALWLEAELDIRLDQTLESALQKGIEISFMYEFQLIKPQKYWFDDEIITERKSITLSYHALTKQFLVHQGKEQTAYDTLNEAKNELTRIRDWRLAPRQAIEKNESYQAALKVHLDQTKLPKALQVDVLNESEWNLSSNTFTWWFKDAPK